MQTGCQVCGQPYIFCEDLKKDGWYRIRKFCFACKATHDRILAQVLLLLYEKHSKEILSLKTENMKLRTCLRKKFYTDFIDFMRNIYEYLTKKSSEK